LSAVKISISNKKLCIVCLYRAPDGDINQFIEQLDATNINYLNGNHKKIQLQSLLYTYNLAQIIDFPTRIGPTTASLIDHFFLDKNVCNKFQTHSVINGFSDHDRQS
jgi:hypothetical protein